MNSVPEGENTFNMIVWIANTYFDGHFTVMGFTGNWRVSFGYQPQNRSDIEAMPASISLMTATAEALKKAPWPAATNTIKVESKKDD